MHLHLFGREAGGRPPRARAISLAAIVALLALLLPAAAGIASAHTANVTLTCSGGLSVNLTNYNDQHGHTNTVSITIDGVALQGSPFSFGGETSGNFQEIKEIYLDCDGDTLLLKVDQKGGAACHTGFRSCFHQRFEKGEWKVKGKRVFDPKEVYGE